MISLEQFQKEKQQMEEDLQKLIWDFEMKYNVRFKKIDVQRQYIMSKPYCKIDMRLL